MRSGFWDPITTAGRSERAFSLEDRKETEPVVSREANVDQRGRCRGLERTITTITTTIIIVTTIVTIREGRVCMSMDVTDFESGLQRSVPLSSQYHALLHGEADGKVLSHPR